MTVKIDGVEPNIFPDVDDFDARDAGRNVEVFLDVRVDGKQTPVTVRLSYEQELLTWLLFWSRSSPKGLPINFDSGASMISAAPTSCSASARVRASGGGSSTSCCVSMSCRALSVSAMTKMASSVSNTDSGSAARNCGLPR